MGKVHNLNIYTAYYTSPDPDLHGAAFAALLELNGIIDTRTTFSEGDTYMMLWMKCIADIVEKEIGVMPLLPQDVLHVNVFVWHTNIRSVCTKMLSVYNSLKRFHGDDMLPKLLHRKLLRGNLTKYDHHDQQYAIVTALLQVSRKTQLHIKFKPLQPTAEHMRTAFQLAAITFDESHSDAVENATALGGFREL